MEPDAYGIVDSAQLGLTLPAHFALEDATPVAEAMADDFQTIDIHRPHPYAGLAGGPGFDGVVIFIAVTAALGLRAYVQEFFKRMASDHYDALRRAMTAGTAHARAKTNEPFGWDILFDQAGDLDEPHSRLSFSARGETPEDLVSMSEAILPILGALPDARPLRAGWSWDTPSQTWIPPVEKPQDLESARLLIAAEELDPLQAAVHNLRDHGWEPFLEYEGGRASPAGRIAATLAVSYKGVGSSDFVRNFPRLLASDAYKLVRDCLRWACQQTTADGTAHGTVVCLTVGSHRFHCDFMDDPETQRRLLAAREILASSPVKFIERDDAAPDDWQGGWYWRVSEQQ